MNTGSHTPKTALRIAVPWWFLPAFIGVGQLLMRSTGYSTWAAQVGQEFMLTIMFYMSMLGPVLVAGLYVSIRKAIERLESP